MSTISNEELIEKISGVVEGCQPTTQEIAMATELLALRKERERAEPVHDPDVCDHEVFEKGASACLVDIPKDVAEIICRGISAATGCMIDWHYVGGRVHIKALRTVPPALPVAVPVVPDGLRIALSNAGIAAPESDEMLWASQQDYIQMLVTWVKDRKPFKTVAVPEWTNEECFEFLSIAFRHAEIKGDFELDDLRLGVKMVNESRAAMLAAPGKEG